MTDEAYAAAPLRRKKATPNVGRLRPPIADSRAFKIGEARDRLPQIVAQVQSGSVRSVTIGSRGESSLLCVSYPRYGALIARGNKTEKLALLIVDELLPDAPPHLRTPAIAELAQLTMGDLEKLWEVESLPLSVGKARDLKRLMENPGALDRLSKRAEIAHVLVQAREAGLYDALEDAMQSVLDRTNE
jgi:hypothetical protein